MHAYMQSMDGNDTGNGDPPPKKPPTNPQRQVPPTEDEPK